MPSIILKLNRRQAANLYDITLAMSGGGSIKAVHRQVRTEIFKVWPEIAPGDGRKTSPGEVREFNLEPTAQRAIAEGFLGLANDPKTTGGEFEEIVRNAQLCRVWGWVEKHIVQLAVKPFDGVLDGEPDLLDPAPA